MFRDVRTLHVAFGFYRLLAFLGKQSKSKFGAFTIYLESSHLLRVSFASTG